MKGGIMSRDLLLKIEAFLLSDFLQDIINDDIDNAKISLKCYKRFINATKNYKEIILH